ncbi:EGF-like and EMI domain-containing protein 1 [Myotis davidii]|uniref:EGF-like and EMI domain-containing protein 1 n=1 Tax=Myotis davidii TaxID=225400 RepID=L5LV44_MYODS|nr:EGF-like and EMI domain-containing protein 1 [Myotis davidii]
MALTVKSLPFFIPSATQYLSNSSNSKVKLKEKELVGGKEPAVQGAALACSKISDTGFCKEYLAWIELEIVNSCEKNNGGCSHHCEHALGGPHCSCNHGHRLDSDEKTCIDLDECESGEACCAQLCINYLGGYECSCKEGFQISSDGCGCDALDDDELEEGEEELEVVRFAGLLFKSPSRLLHYVASSLPPTYQDEASGCPKGLFGKNCKRKCNCANNGHCHRVYGACVCEPGRYGRFCHLNCPKGAYGAGCASECQCVEENTLECSAKNGSCTCKSGYQGNRCQKGTI